MSLAEESLGQPWKATPGQVSQLSNELSGWQVIKDGMDKLEKDYTFGTFQEALDFCNRVGGIAEKHGHHPQITFTWGAATVRWWSHSLGGLTRNDFIMAAKTDTVVA